MKWTLLLLSCLLILARVVTAESFDGRDRSPVDVILAPDQSWLISVNQMSDSVSLLSATERKVLDEIAVGDHPSGAALGPDGSTVWVACTYSGELIELTVAEGKLQETARVHVGNHPTGLAIAPQKRRAYVALTAASQVVGVDLEQKTIVERIEVGRWPRYLAVAPDEQKLVVGTSGDRGVSFVDLASGKMVALVNRFKPLNIGHMQISKDGQYAYFPWMHYGENVPSPGNIRRGWVIGNRIARIPLNDPESREVLSLDKEGEAVGDAFGLAISADEQQLVVSTAGTHELLVFRLPDLPYTRVGSSEHIPPELLKDGDRFARIPVGGRPLAVRFSADNRHVYVANYLENAIQVVDTKERTLVDAIHLGGPESPSLTRQGEAIFYDAKRSFDQWYSCHSCHYEGGTNSEIVDTVNDGSQYTFKTVLPLYRIKETGPWTWHGYQSDVYDATEKSMITTMVAPKPKAEDVAALVEYLQELSPPPNPNHASDGPLAESVARGKQIFASEKANCITCHSGQYFTDGEIHDVGLGSSQDRYDGFNTPTLVGVYSKVRLLHDGRSRSLDELLRGPHNPARVTGRGELSDAERQDLIEYLKTL